MTVVEGATIAARPHPAKYTPSIGEIIRGELDKLTIEGVVLDPFGGVGGIHAICEGKYPSIAVELEREWADQSAARGETWCGDFFDYEPNVRVGAVVTSPTYGNRFADHHAPKDDSKRHSYKFDLGRDLTDGNSGGMQWGVEYRAFHIKAWIRVREILRGGGYFVLNVKDHVRDKQVVKVADWHRDRVIGTGFRLLEDVKVPVYGMGFGANRELRVDHERVMVFERIRDESRWAAEGRARLDAKREAAVTRHGD